MPVHFEFNSKHKILLVVVKGEIKGADVQSVKAAVTEQANRLQPASLIVDLSRITKFDVTAEIMRSTARQPSPLAESVPSFLVAPQEYLFGMARMYEQVASGKRPNLKVAHTLQEALAALGVENPEFEHVE
ncbi:MAG TPA: hypothetical protein VE377_10215 [Candidatus Dormibacteraeota bacterium]|nr:hypothetical protein [Candidatus Dormibacteraeota bacterium]